MAEQEKISSSSITSFHGEYSFLSNFYPSPVEMDGVLYPTVEHAYQAAKTKDHYVRIGIAEMTKPGRAKAAGRRIKPPKDWFSYNLQLMEDLVTQKFSVKHSELRRKLLQTGTATLVEGNNWGDKFFGMVRDKKKTCPMVGENHLGKILMKVRANIILLLQEEEEASSSTNDAIV